MNESIPDPSVRRLSAYLRQLEVLAEAGVHSVSSRQLAGYMRVGDAQVRRDLTLFGQFGRPGVGYDVTDLIRVLRGILGTRSRWKAIVAGAGQLCRALVRYEGFASRGFELVAAFDTDPDKLGEPIGEVQVRPMAKLGRFVSRHEVRLAILTVPADAAQEVTDQLVAAGIEGILNFAVAGLETPPHVHVSTVDITAHLEQLSFQVSANRAEPSAAPAGDGAVNGSRT